jgi:hypothetical protein
MKPERQPRIDRLVDARWGQIRIMFTHPAALQQERASMRLLHPNIADYFTQRFSTPGVEPTSARMHALGVTSAYGALRIFLGEEVFKKIAVFPETLEDHQRTPTPFFLPNPIPGGAAIDISLHVIQERSPLLATFARKVLSESSLLGTRVGQIGPETSFLTGVYEIADLFGNALKHS